MPWLVEPSEATTFRLQSSSLFRCSSLTVGEDKRGKEGEAANPFGLSMQPDAATRRRSKVRRYR